MARTKIGQEEGRPVSNTWIVVALSLAAALAFALSSSLKHVSAGRVPDAQSLRPSKLAGFVRATVSHRLWLAGIGCDVVGLSLQILALHLGALSVVQPLLLSSLLFALLVRARFEHHSISRRQAVWALVLTAALAGFLLLVTAPALPVHEVADRAAAGVAVAVGVVLVAVCVLFARRQRSSGRTAALMGTAVGVIYAATAALLKAVTDIAARHPLGVLTSWQLYTVIGVGGAGMLLSQLTFQAGPLTASLPATASVDPLLSIVVGVLVYHEQVRLGLAAEIGLIGLLAVLGTAVLQLSRSPDEKPVEP